jgi:hypothetical protein
MQRTRSNSTESPAKSTNLIDIPSLITVWLQVRVLPGPPMKSAGYISYCFGASGTAPEMPNFDARFQIQRRANYCSAFDLTTA